MSKNIQQGKVGQTGKPGIDGKAGQPGPAVKLVLLRFSDLKISSFHTSTNNLCSMWTLRHFLQSRGIFYPLWPNIDLPWAKRANFPLERGHTEWFDWSGCHMSVLRRIKPWFQMIEYTKIDGRIEFVLRFYYKLPGRSSVLLNNYSITEKSQLFLHK